MVVGGAGISDVEEETAGTNVMLLLPVKVATPELIKSVVRVLREAGCAAVVVATVDVETSDTVDGESIDADIRLCWSTEYRLSSPDCEERVDTLALFAGFGSWFSELAEQALECCFKQDL